MIGKDIADIVKLIKEIMQYFLRQNTHNHSYHKFIKIEGKKPEDLNVTKAQNKKQIRRLLLTITVIDSEWLTAKSKLITDTEEFIELYNRQNSRQVDKFYGIVKLER